MASLISPAEALGLSGAALESRCKRAAHHISDRDYHQIAERMRADAMANEMVYEHAGVPEPVRVMLRPVLARREQLIYVHYVCQQISEALKPFPALYLKNPEIRNILKVSDEESSWLKEIWTPEHGRYNPVYGRLDAVCDFAGAAWQDTLKFMEPNLSGVGGIHYSPVAEQMVMRDIVPSLVAHDPELSIELMPDQRDLFVQLLIDHARALGRASCNICFVEPKYEHDGPAEQSVLIQFLIERFGLTIVHADPRELRAEGDEVFYEDTKIDIAYRDYETRDLILLEKELGKPLDGMRLLLKQNRMISSLTGDFDHKSCFEILTDPDIAARLFSPEDCRLFERHVLWTRVAGARNTTLPNHTTGDLLTYARANRELLVLKPNRAYGGEGVAIGALCSEGEWERLLDDAASKSDDPNLSLVLQSATRLPIQEFPVVGDDGRVYGEPFYAVMGFAPTDNGLGILCRVSQKQVVNVAQHGGLAAVLIANPLKDLRIPQRSLKRKGDALTALRLQIAELHHLDQTIALMEWDEETYLPAAGLQQRGEQTATIESLRHGILVSDHFADLIEEATAEIDGNIDLERELFLVRRERRRALALPENLVRNFANGRARALGAWEEAREKNDFQPFAIAFGDLLHLVRERAQCQSDGGERYDCLLDEYEPGLTRARLEPLLLEMRERLVPLVQRAAERSARFKDSLIGRRFAEERQWELSRRMLAAIGFDFERGRLDPTTHPFTMLVGRDDVRVTSRADEADVTTNLLATLHEGGHGLYDQGFAARDRDSFLGDGPSMGMHEAQARLWENHVGRSLAFCEFLFPQMRELFSDALDGIDPRSFWRSLNQVRAGTKRIGADEMSYHLHIILRTELEVALVSGQLAVKDLMQVWNERSRALLGVEPASPRDGVLQDVHWAVGMFGYFPTYTIGSLYAAQLVETYATKNALDDEMRAGECGKLREWLRANVYELGNRHSAEDIVTRATGKGLDTAAFFRHVESSNRAWNAAD